MKGWYSLLSILGREVLGRRGEDNSSEDISAAGRVIPPPGTAYY